MPAPALTVPLRLPVCTARRPSVPETWISPAMSPLTTVIDSMPPLTAWMTPVEETPLPPVPIPVPREFSPPPSTTTAPMLLAVMVPVRPPITRTDGYSGDQPDVCTKEYGVWLMVVPTRMVPLRSPMTVRAENVLVPPGMTTCGLLSPWMPAVAIKVPSRLPRSTEPPACVEPYMVPTQAP